jgi:hypothetical protein
MSAIVDFSREGRARPDGPTLRQIMSWSDQEMEQSRNAFEWLFLLDRSTRDEPRAPILTEEEVAQFKSYPELRTALLKSLIGVLRMYGLKIAVTRGQIA